MSIGEHCLVHYYYYILGKDKWFKEANNSSWKMLMKIHLGEVCEECKDNIVLMKLYCDTIDKKEYTYKSYERSDETIKKISEKNKGRKMSEETIEKNRIAHLGKVSKKKIKIIQFSTDMVFIREWDSATDVEKELGFFKSNIRKCCRGERKSAYGFIWKYK